MLLCVRPASNWFGRLRRFHGTTALARRLRAVRAEILRGC